MNFYSVALFFKTLYFHVHVHRFAAKLVSSGTLVLVCVVQKDASTQLTVNTEKTVIGSMLLHELQIALAAP